MNRLRIEYFYENGTAEILHTISSDIGNVTSVANQMTTLSITSVLQVFGGIIGLAVLDWKMAVFILLFIPLKFLLVYYFPNPDKPEPKFCHFAQEIVVKCLKGKIKQLSKC